MTKKLRDLLASKRMPWVAAVAAFVLGLPTLTMGVMLDDFVMRYVVQKTGPFPGGPRGVWDLYRFADGGEGVHDAIAMGLYPWWSSPHLKLAFFRPLSSLWVAVDQSLFVGSPWIAHLGSVLLAAALAAVVGKLYGRLLGGATAGLAALFYAVDDAHSMPVLWSANRHALLSAFLGFAALLAHTRRAPRTAVSLFALALAAGESVFGVLPYFFAYAWFTDERGRRPALLSLVPYGALFVVWAVLYVAMGYGVDGSTLYVHPGQSPGRFALALVERAPALVLAQLFGPPAEIWGMLPREQQRVTLIPVLIGAALLTWLLLRATRGHRLQGFFVCGAALSILPLCATAAADRMLLFPGFGAFGLLAIAAGRVGRKLLDGRATILGLAGAGAVVFVHLVVAAPMLPIRAKQAADLFGAGVARGAASLPSDLHADQTVFVLVAPDPLMTQYMFLERLFAESGRPYATGSRVLGIAQKGTVRVERTSDRVLVLRASEGGLYSDLFSSVYREKPLELGAKMRAADMTGTVLEVDARGYPSAVALEWDAPIGGESNRWLVWRGRAFAEVALPPVGEALEVETTEWMAAYGP